MAFFSILANELKSDIITIEELKEKISNSPIQPKPVCRSLDFIFGWKTYITPWLADPPLTNHSKYNSFAVKKEDGRVKFRAKKLPQDLELVPRAGLRLLKENTVYCPVESAEFRTEEIMFDRIFKAVATITSKLQLSDKMRIQGSWDRLRESLEAFPRKRENLRKMLITDLPKQVRNNLPAVPDFLRDVDDDAIISGDLHAEDIAEGTLEEIHEDLDVCVYTAVSVSRPWVGRVKQMMSGRKFVIQWFGRKSGRGKTFTALVNQDGTPSLCELEMDTIMFWGMTENRREDSFMLSQFWLETIRLEYEKLDS